MAQVLVVDDNEFMRTLLTVTLDHAGYAVVTANDGRDALKQIERHSIDLVVTDLLMPEMDGLELITALRRSRPDLPVIAMSGGSPKSHTCLERAKELGAVQSLEKPFRMQRLLEAVAQVLQSQPR